MAGPSPDALRGLVERAASIVSTIAGGSLGIVTLVGVGWATVELDRAQDELSRALDVPAPAWRPASRDPLLGAQVRLADLPTRGLRRGSPPALGPLIAVAIVEPDTEGRIAASLARGGEGVAVAWVAGAGGRERPVLSRPEAGPLGSGRLVLGGRAWGPHLIVLERPPRLEALPSRP